MNSKLLLVFTIVFSLFQGPFLPPVLSEGFLVVLSGGNISKKTFFALFLAGIIFDLVQGKAIGATSLIFLGFLFLLYSLRNQIFAKSAFFISLIVLLVDAARMWFVFGAFFIPVLIFVFLSSFLFFHFAIISHSEPEIKLNA